MGSNRENVIMLNRPAAVIISAIMLVLMTMYLAGLRDVREAAKEAEKAVKVVAVEKERTDLLLCNNGNERSIITYQEAAAHAAETKRQVESLDLGRLLNLSPEHVKELAAQVEAHRAERLTHLQKVLPYTDCDTSTRIPFPVPPPKLNGEQRGPS